MPLRYDRRYTTDEVGLLDRHLVAKARSHFWFYRQALNPNMLIGWWQREVATQLQAFYNDIKEGKRPKLVLCSPPQHGKSRQVIDFVSYFIGQQPDRNVIFASYSNRLSTRANLWVQRIMDGKTFGTLFPRTKLQKRGERDITHLRNLDVLEFVDRQGSFRNTTVLGSVTGEGLHLGVVDDPLKGRKEAQSELIRDNVWGWFTDDFFTRFADDAALLMTVTRWHLDDPVGRLKELFPEVRVLAYPALAEHEELHRHQGDPLFPQLKSKEFLLERRSLMTKASWESVYQQNPIIQGGDLFPVEEFWITFQRPAKDKIKKSVRFWDKAGTQDAGAYTAGVLIDHLNDGRFIVADVQRGQWSALERERRILQTAHVDNAINRTAIYVEQEPGSGGKESAEATIRMLAGFDAHADRVSGAKELRAEPYAAQVQAGNVGILKADWNREFLHEHEVFPHGKYMDQVDASAGAFNWLTNAYRPGIAITGHYGIARGRPLRTHVQ